MRLEVRPPQLREARIPLHDAAVAIRTVTDCRREVLALVPPGVVREALEDALSRWELSAWAAADAADTLGAGLDQAGHEYRRVDAGVLP
ncbi:MAG: hypothetical protein LC789_11480 [Actinobacteria bacterium]|nr:hypothetical protein [Actinomycetota bacterium]MCA1720608.1 hypothetical protein [Actinomycetota bacterium]